MKEVESEKISLKCINQNLSIVCAMTDQSKDRHTLVTATELLKKDSELNDADVEIAWPTRSVEL